MEFSLRVIFFSLAFDDYTHCECRGGTRSGCDPEHDSRRTCFLDEPG